MRPLRDPEHAELNHLVKPCLLTGKTILEVGCGNGIFTFQYSSMAKKVMGIDPEIADLRLALSDKRKDHSQFLHSVGEHLPFPCEAFDLVVFGSSV
jgi:ubiquinone/menaquinone biosynthesis C-methylase UbiE